MGRVTAALAEGSGTEVNITVSGITEYNETYHINVPQLGANKAAVFAVASESAPVTVTYNNGEEDVALDGAEGVPCEADVKVTFGIPITAGTDVSVKSLPCLVFSDSEFFHNKYVSLAVTVRSV